MVLGRARLNEPGSFCMQTVLNKMMAFPENIPSLVADKVRLR
jgi:hypothetical protein